MFDPLKGLAVNLPSSKACMLKRTLFNLKQKRSATATIKAIQDGMDSRTIRKTLGERLVAVGRVYQEI